MVKFSPGIFLFTIISRSALGSSQSPLQWVLEAVSQEVMWMPRDAGHSSVMSDFFLTPHPYVLPGHIAYAQGQLCLYVIRYCTFT
jgi:hypothetical protein